MVMAMSFVVEGGSFVPSESMILAFETAVQFLTIAPSRRGIQVVKIRFFESSTRSLEEVDFEIVIEDPASNPTSVSPNSYRVWKINYRCSPYAIDRNKTARAMLKACAKRLSEIFAQEDRLRRSIKDFVEQYKSET